VNDKDILKKELIERKEHCRLIVDGLKDNIAFKTLVDDFAKLLKNADDTWHMIPVTEQNKLLELRISKIAGLSIINVISNYENEIAILNKEISGINNPETIQSSYYDAE